MIVLRTPKGWTGPKEVDGEKVEGTWRSHQVPLSETHTNPDHMAQLEKWLRSYQPEKLFDDSGALRAELRALAPAGQRRMSANPHANGGLLLRDLDLPAFPDYAVAVDKPATETAEATKVLGTFLRDVIAAQPRPVPADGPGRDRFQPASGRCSSQPTRRGWPRPSRRRASRAGRPGDGGALRAPVPGLAGGLSADRPPRPVQLLRGVRAHRRLDAQSARQVADEQRGAVLAAAHRIIELPSDVTCLASGP